MRLEIGNIRSYHLEYLKDYRVKENCGLVHKWIHKNLANINPELLIVFVQMTSQTPIHHLRP